MICGMTDELKTIGESTHLDPQQLVVLALRQQLGLPVTPTASVAHELLRPAAQIALENKLLGEFAAAMAAWLIVPPIDVMTMISNYRAKARRKARLALPTLHLLDKALTRAGIPWVAYKGHMLQLQLGRKLDRRTNADLDVLVHKSDFDRALHALQAHSMSVAVECRSAWWRDWLGELTLTMPDSSGLPVDLHYKIQQPGCPAPRETGLLIGRSIVLQLDGIRIPTLNRVDAALNGAICIVKAIARHEYAGSHILDFAAMLQNTDPAFEQALAAEAAHQRLERTLSLARSAAAQLLGEPKLSGLDSAVPKTDWHAVLLAPDQNDHAKIRGRALLWALSDGRILTRTSRFVRESFVVIAAERARRRGEMLAS